MGAKPLSTEEKDEILKLFYEGHTSVAISEKINRNPSSIQKYIKSLGLSWKQGNQGYIKKVSQQEIALIIEMYQNDCSCAVIREYLDNKVCENTILKILKDNNIKIRPRGHIPFKINNIDYFKCIDTEYKAYIIGLLISDGYILKADKKNPVWGISLKLEDEYILQEILNQIGLTKKLINDRDNCKMLLVTSTDMVNDLQQYGIVQRKSFKVRLPKNIPYKLIRHLIRGIFDGDGTVFINSKDRLYFGFYGNHFILTEIKELLIKEINISDNKITDKDTLSQMAFSKKEDILNFYNYLYNESNVYLIRKKDRFTSYIEQKFQN